MSTAASTSRAAQWAARQLSPTARSSLPVRHMSWSTARGLQAAPFPPHPRKGQHDQRRNLATVVPPTSSLSNPVPSAPASAGGLQKPDHAVISVFDLFSIGVGPSSSHTVGPMRASKMFIDDLTALSLLPRVHTLKAALHGSLAATGVGHMTPQALLLGLEGETPEGIRTEDVGPRYERMKEERVLRLAGTHPIRFDMVKDLAWNMACLPAHPNGIRLSVFDVEGDMVWSRVYYSVGGGFVVTEGDMQGATSQLPPTSALEQLDHDHPRFPYRFATADALEAITRDTGLSIAGVVRANERAAMRGSVAKDQADGAVRDGLGKIWGVMEGCIEEGVQSKEMHLPGRLRLKRRAPFLHQRFHRGQAAVSENPSSPLPLLAGVDEMSCYAIAVNEVNAAGGRVVTAPTNGAAGVIPAVLKYFTNHWSGNRAQQVEDFLLTAGALGMLFKHGASISAAEGGCMAEVGVASSMAAGALAGCMGGTPKQVLEAAEIAMEQSLGLTCDPVDGLVQVPCIERNSLGAVKAVAAAQLALSGQGTPIVSLDAVIDAMRQTARDMHSHYKETSLSGLATSVKIPLATPTC